MNTYEFYPQLESWAVLSVRLGLGKGGLRMAPEEALGEILQVGICYYSVFCPFKPIRSDVNTFKINGLYFICL